MTGGDEDPVAAPDTTPPAVTSHDVARAAGVSQATVSRVLHDHPRVAPATRARVLRALEETGYVPNLLARAMRTRRTGTIGVVVDRITNPFYPQVMEALAARLAHERLRMVLWTSDGAGEASALDAIGQGLVDGLVFTTVTGDSRPLSAALRRRAPIVLVNRGLDGVECDQVVTDNVGGGAAVARYLAAHDHARVACVGGPPLASTAVQRRDGFARAFADLGVDLGEDWFVPGDFSRRRGHEAVRALLARPRPPTAVFCVNDLTAFGAIDGARSAGARVPEDVWVVGFDDIEMASWEAFDLTTVRQPIEAMVDRAVALLLDRIQRPGRPGERVRFDSALVVRGSTAHAPAADAYSS